MARQSFAAAGFAPGRARLIAGAARDVLPRLADGAYDLVFIDGDIEEYAHGVSAAHRLLRPGGVMVVNNAHAEGLDERGRLIITELTAYLRDTPDWSTTVLAVGAGLLCATRAWSEGR
jgi:predicted O-methyltransferase YrrM